MFSVPLGSTSYLCLEMTVGNNRTNLLGQVNWCTSTEKYGCSTRKFSFLLKQNHHRGTLVCNGTRQTVRLKKWLTTSRLWLGGALGGPDHRRV